MLTSDAGTLLLQQVEQKSRLIKRINRPRRKFPVPSVLVFSSSPVRRQVRQVCDFDELVGRRPPGGDVRHAALVR